MLYLRSIVRETLLQMRRGEDSVQLRFLVIDQLDAQLFSTYLFQFPTCFEQLRAHHQENQLYQYSIWYMSLCVGDRFVCRSPT